jgi:hypothetical protein
MKTLHEALTRIKEMKHSATERREHIAQAAKEKTKAASHRASQAMAAAGTLVLLGIDHLHQKKPSPKTMRRVRLIALGLAVGVGAGMFLGTERGRKTRLKIRTRCSSAARSTKNLLVDAVAYLKGKPTSSVKKVEEMMTAVQDMISEGGNLGMQD